MEYHVVIPAAGTGKRMGMEKNKLLVPIDEIPVLVHTLKIFENDNWCKSITLVIHKQDRAEISDLIEQFQLRKIAAIVEGGSERQQSVYKGLQQLQSECIVLIHDGARPFVKQKYLHQLVEKANHYGGAVLAVPVKDTIKKVRNRFVEETIDRSTLWSIQTPQAFQLHLIMNAHKKAEEDGYIGTDDASLLERFGGKVVVVEGDYENFKITTPEDLIFANAIIQRQKGNE